MGFNEIKLTIAIEDPRARERRENLGIEVGQPHLGKVGPCLLSCLTHQIMPWKAWHCQATSTAKPSLLLPLPALQSSLHVPQDESGVSRDELAAALQEVAEGRIPKV